MDERKPPQTDPDAHGVTLAPGVRVRADDLEITFVRASGPGGQNVNKRATKARLRVALSAIPLSERAAARLRRLAGNAVNNADEIIIEREDTRSQGRNRRACIDRLRELVARALVEPATRRPTKPTKGSVRRRLEEKTQRARIKKLRRPPGEHD